MKKISLTVLIEVLIIDLLAPLLFYQPNSGTVLPATFLFLFHGLVLLHFFNHILDHFPEQYPFIRGRLRGLTCISIIGDLASLGLSQLITYWLVFLVLLLCHLLLFLSLMKHLHQQFPKEFSQKLSYFDIL